MQQLEHAVLEIVLLDGAKSLRARVGQEILHHVGGQLGGMHFDEVDQFCGDHDGSSPGGCL